MRESMFILGIKKGKIYTCKTIEYISELSRSIDHFWFKTKCC